MTKFRDLDDDQRGAFKELFMRGLDRRIKEEMDFTNQAFRLLMLGNGAGIALLASFIGAVAGRGHPVGDLVSPLWKFLLGVVCAGLISAPFMAVASQATNHTINQLMQFFRNEIDIESMQGWGFTKRGRIVIGGLSLLSLLFFVIGVMQCIWLLNTLKT
jgi:hypothetical protein